MRFAGQLVDASEVDQKTKDALAASQREVRALRDAAAKATARAEAAEAEAAKAREGRRAALAEARGLAARVEELQLQRCLVGFYF